ncbi:MAG: hypothetical protein PHO42_03845 [Candidatus Omnitrophica bacterium]|nr:hypothetical protein [Candidatus Omnitrophota bacterium]
MKKSVVCVFSFLVALIFINYSQAAARYSGDIGTAVSYIKYEEPDFMKNEGIMYGLNGSYAYYNKKLMLKAEGLFSSGEVDYTSTSTGSMDGLSDVMLEGRGLLGLVTPAKNKFKFTPYTGAAYRYLYDDARGTTTTGHRGYERESNYFYSPVGIDMEAALNETWSVGSIIEYDIFWRGWQISHLSDVSLGYNDLENTQRNGYGVRASARFVKKGLKTDLIIEPFIRYWNIGDSDKTAITYSGVIVDVGYEPHNKTTEYGVNIKIGF